jgi:hypothetical protein
VTAWNTWKCELLGGPWDGRAFEIPNIVETIYLAEPDPRDYSNVSFFTPITLKTVRYRLNPGLGKGAVLVFEFDWSAIAPAG